jgi:hypothetical protein
MLPSDMLASVMAAMWSLVFEQVAQVGADVFCWRTEEKLWQLSSYMTFFKIVLSERR